MCVERWGTIDSIPSRAEVEARISSFPVNDLSHVFSKRWLI